MTEPFKVRAESVVGEARGIRRFRLVSLDGAALPAATPGSHIDVWAPGGPVRQYSLCEPGGRNGYTIAVQLEQPSRGGSAAMHRVRDGDVLEISPPRNTFPLYAQAREHILIAGGIGITPILAMARHLATAGDRFELHYFARSAEHMAFRSVVAGAELGAFTRLYLGLDPQGTVAALSRLIGNYPRRQGAHLYCCGPAPLMDAARDTAQALGWPVTALHEERFTASQQPDTGGTGFRVLLARRGGDLGVGAEETVLDALIRAGVEVDTSCEQGICGTCVTAVLDGDIDHRDQYLTDDEKAAGDRMCVCVSRCRGDRLVLDL